MKGKKGFLHVRPLEKLFPYLSHALSVRRVEILVFCINCTDSVLYWLEEVIFLVMFVENLASDLMVTLGIADNLRSSTLGDL